MRKEDFWMFVLKSLLAGFMIGVGGLAYIITGSPLVFPIGLLIVCLYDLRLFTGKVCYRFYSVPAYVAMYLLNGIGAAIFGLLSRIARPDFIDKAAGICNMKLSESMPRLAVLSVLCNLMIFLAVDTFAIYVRSKEFYTSAGIMSIIVLIFSTSIFVMCGFEHCIANIFYFAYAGVPTTIKFLVVNVIFNAIGGILFGYVFRTASWNIEV